VNFNLAVQVQPMDSLVNVAIRNKLFRHYFKLPTMYSTFARWFYISRKCLEAFFFKVI